MLSAPAMKPGEYRWVSFDMASFKASAGTSLPVDLLELVERGGQRFPGSMSCHQPLRRPARVTASHSGCFRRLQLQLESADAAMS